ncbi:MAG: helix-turn-helix domain-containing protein [Candidatus Nanohalobium sp.]
MPVEKQRPENLQFVKDLSDKGYDDILVLKQETVQKVLTEKRTELLEHIKEKEPESVRELARRVDRDPGQVSKDLKVLYESELVEFEEKKGKKAPRIRHRNVFPEPVISEK